MNRNERGRTHFMRNVIVSFILMLFIPAMASAMSSRPSIKQEYLFEFSHINFAWGFQMSGMYIDKQGNVYTYDHSHEPWKPSSDEYLTEQDLQEKFAHKNEQVKSIDISVLKRMHKLIIPASRGKLSERVNRCFDFGSGSYSTYLYDAQTKRYTNVLLYQYGDWAKKNLSEEAKVLYEWLFDVFGNEPADCTP